MKTASDEIMPLEIDKMDERLRVRASEPRQRRTVVTILNDIQAKLDAELDARSEALEDLTKIDTRIRVLREILTEAEKIEDSGEAE